MSIHLAENLRMLRQKNRYTLEELAEIISVSRQTVAKWESADSFPDIMNCTKLAALYKVTLDELVNKPLYAAVEQDYLLKGNSLCGMVEISEEGSVKLHKNVMKLFDIHPGEKLLLFADKERGIALVRCSPLD